MVSVTEVWKPVPGFQHYEASSLGRVRCVAHCTMARNRWGICERNYPTRILKAIPHRGYHTIKLGRPNTAYHVHQVVAWAFLGEQPEGMTVNHIDGNKNNNLPGNLEYLSGPDNVRHAHRTGLINNFGARNGNSRTKRKARAAA